MLSDLFYIINFSISIIFSFLALLFAFTTVFVVCINRQRHTISNLLTCDTALAIILFYINNLISIGYSFRHNWNDYQPGCILRGYIFVTSCTALCYSYLIQAISRLFFTIFYKNKKLQTKRIHYLMIFINWILAFLIAIPPIYLNGYILEIESHLCIPTTKIFSSTIYIIFSVYLLPLISIGIIYSIIYFNAHQSKRRIINSMIQTNLILPNYKREFKIMKNILILLGILACAGTPYIIVVFWQITQSQLPPESFYLLIINCIYIFASFMMIALFFMNHDIRKVTKNYLKKIICALN